jgi:ATP-dependent DNA helicase RecQ
MEPVYELTVKFVNKFAGAVRYNRRMAQSERMIDADALSAEVRARFGVMPRPPQLALIQRALGGRSSLGVMPTGSGKSLTYLASAALLDGTVLVVSPLISLMRDQVEKAKESLQVARLDSTLDRDEARETLRSLSRGRLDLLYVAPERLANERFLAALGRIRVPLLAVDEAHCISAWGHDFRPDYLRLPLLRADLGDPPVLALTATAPPTVQADICETLAVPDDGLVHTGSRRPNLALNVEAPADRDRRLLELVRSDPSAPTIVYALRQADTERLAALLDQSGVAARPYHAGLEPETRAETQDAFLRDEIACVVATIAFGMGVDKPNVRRVIHAHAPRSLEGYVQEVGRAGRDGQPATGVLLYDDTDLPALANFVEAKAPGDEQIRGALNEAFTSKESADVIAFNPYTVGDAHDLDAVAVRTLFARLELRGIVRALTPAYDTYQLPLTHDPELTAGLLGERDGAIWRQLVGQAKRGRVWQTLQLREAARAIDVPLAVAIAVVRRAEEEAGVELRATGLMQRYEILRRPDRQTDTPALLASVADALEGERRRLASVRGYVLAEGCRQAHAVAYLGDKDTSPCGICDLCTGTAPLRDVDLPRLDWRASLDLRAVKSMAAEIGRDDVAIARALCQVTTSRSRPYRRHRAWGVLERAPYEEVLTLVRETLDAE